MIESETSIRVRYAETDKMGIVYHANYLTWFEAARIELLDNLGVPYLQLEKEGYLLPVLEASARFIRPARFDDRIVVKLKIKEKPVVKIKIEYDVIRTDETLVTGQTVHAFMSPEGTAVRPPQAFMQKMRSYF